MSTGLLGDRKRAFLRSASQPVQEKSIFPKVVVQPQATKLFEGKRFLVPKGLFNGHDWWLVSQVIRFHSGLITVEAHKDVNYILLPTDSQQAIDGLRNVVHLEYSGLPFVATDWIQECVQAGNASAARVGTWWDNFGEDSVNKYRVLGRFLDSIAQWKVSIIEHMNEGSGSVQHVEHSQPPSPNAPVTASTRAVSLPLPSAFTTRHSPLPTKPCKVSVPSSSIRDADDFVLGSTSDATVIGDAVSHLHRHVSSAASSSTAQFAGRHAQFSSRHATHLGVFSELPRDLGIIVDEHEDEYSFNDVASPSPPRFEARTRRAMDLVGLVGLGRPSGPPVFKPSAASAPSSFSPRTLERSPTQASMPPSFESCILASPSYPSPGLSPHPSPRPSPCRSRYKSSLTQPPGLGLDPDPTPSTSVGPQTPSDIETALSATVAEGNDAPLATSGFQFDTEGQVLDKTVTIVTGTAVSSSVRFADAAATSDKPKDSLPEGTEEQQQLVAESEQPESPVYDATTSANLAVSSGIETTSHEIVQAESANSSPRSSAPAVSPLLPADEETGESFFRFKPLPKADPVANAPRLSSASVLGLTLDAGSQCTSPSALSPMSPHFSQGQGDTMKKKTRNQLRKAAEKRKKEEEKEKEEAKTREDKKVKEELGDKLDKELTSLMVNLLPGNKSPDDWVLTSCRTDCECLDNTVAALLEDYLQPVPEYHLQTMNLWLASPEKWSHAPCFLYASQLNDSDGPPLLPTWEEMRAMVEWDLTAEEGPVCRRIVDTYLIAISEVALRRKVMVSDTTYFDHLHENWDHELGCAPNIEASMFSSIKLKQYSRFVFPVFFNAFWYAFLVNLYDESVVCYDPCGHLRDMMQEHHDLDRIIHLLVGGVFGSDGGERAVRLTIIAPRHPPHSTLAPLLVAQACELLALCDATNAFILNTLEFLSETILTSGKWEAVERQIATHDRRVHWTKCRNWATNGWKYCQGVSCLPHGMSSCAPIQSSKTPVVAPHAESHYKRKYVSAIVTNHNRGKRTDTTFDPAWMTMQWYSQYDKENPTPIPSVPPAPEIDPATFNPREGLLNDIIMRTAWGVAVRMVNFASNDMCSASRTRPLRVTNGVAFSPGGSDRTASTVVD